jgi:hypothetical protein
LAVFVTLHLLFERRRWPALVGGLLTAIWLHPPIGVLMVEQTAYTFNLFALLCAVAANCSRHRWAAAGWVAAGASWAMAAWTKQNAGLFFLPVLACAIPLLQARGAITAGRSALWFGAGVSLVTGPILAWLSFRSDPALAWHHMVEIPAAFAAQRMAATPWDAFLRVLYLHASQQASTRWLALACYAAVLAALIVWLRTRPRDPLRLPATLLPVAALVAQVLFSLSMLNEAENALAYLGLAAGAALGLLARLPRHRLAVGALSFFAGWSALFGYHVAVERRVNQFASARFTELVALPRVSGLYWGAPTPLGRKVTNVEKQEFEALARYLKARKCNFFVFPASTILYGLLQRPSPQPWLFFLEGHSFATSDIPRMDQLALDSMRHHDVRVFVKEQDSWLGVERIERMPRLHAWLTQSFAHTRNFGPFEVWERRDGTTREVAGVR